MERAVCRANSRFLRSFFKNPAFWAIRFSFPKKAAAAKPSFCGGKAGQVSADEKYRRDTSLTYLSTLNPCYSSNGNRFAAKVQGKKRKIHLTMQIFSRIANKSISEGQIQDVLPRPVIRRSTERRAPVFQIRSRWSYPRRTYCRTYCRKYSRLRRPRQRSKKQIRKRAHSKPYQKRNLKSMGPTETCFRQQYCRRKSCRYDCPRM